MKIIKLPNTLNYDLVRNGIQTYLNHVPNIIKVNVENY